MNGISTTKFCKGTDIPKRSGNFSPMTVHYNSRRERTYHVYFQAGELIVGEHTPLEHLLPLPVVLLALHDEHFEEYRQQGVHTINGKEYEAHKTLRKVTTFGTRSWRNYRFTYTETIYTDYEIKHDFPNY